MLRQRKRRLLDVTQHHGIAAVSYLAVVMPVGVAAALFGWGSPRLFVTLGLAALVGWLGQSTLGYLLKIVPFLIWQSRYGALVGRQKVPLMRDLVHQRWATSVSGWSTARCRSSRSSPCSAGSSRSSWRRRPSARDSSWPPRTSSASWRHARHPRRSPAPELPVAQLFARRIGHHRRLPARLPDQLNRAASDTVDGL